MKTYIHLLNINKQYSRNVLLDDVSLLIEEKSKIGMIGRNGAGKTTLLKILKGEEEADSGQVVFNEEMRLGYLRQNDDFNEDDVVLNYLVEKSGKEAWFCAKVAYTFGIDHNRVNAQIKELSSGFRMRLKLTQMLLDEPNFLLLDEPSNYLDLNTLINLENFLMEFNGGYIIVSHDREFLKNTCDQTIEVSPRNVTYFHGGIEDYFEHKERVQIQISRHNKNIDREKEHLQRFVDRFRSKASKATQVQSRIKQMDKLKHIDIAHPSKSINIMIPNIDIKNGFSLISDSLVIGYGDKVIAKSNRIEIARGSHVAILGENGEGKTTLLSTLASQIEALGGSYTYSQGTTISYFAEALYKNMSSNENVLGFMRQHSDASISEKELLSLLGSFLFSGENVYKPISVLSGGEKSRLLLLATVIQKSDVLILDEPTNHLDFETVEALGDALSKYNGTILFTSHDRTFVSLLSDMIVEVKKGGINVYPSNYDDYVYHIKEEMLNNISAEEEYLKKENANNNANKKNADSGVSDYHARKELKSNLTKLNTTIKKIEQNIAAYEEEKNTLLKEFETIVEYDEKKYTRMSELKKLLEQEEMAWMEAAEQKSEYEKLIQS